MSAILDSKQLSHEEVDARIAKRVSDFRGYPPLAQVIANSPALDFGHFAIFCTAVDLDYHDVVNGIGFQDDEQKLYWRWATGP